MPYHSWLYTAIDNTILHPVIPKDVSLDHPAPTVAVSAPVHVKPHVYLFIAVDNTIKNWHK